MYQFSNSVTSNSLLPHGLYPPGSSVHGILQVRTLQWAPFLPPRDLPDPGTKSTSLESLALAGGLFFIFIFLPLVIPGKLPKRR